MMENIHFMNASDATGVNVICPSIGDARFDRRV